MRNSKVFFALALMFAVVFTGCEKTDPDIPSDRDKFLGNWKGVSTGNGGTRNFNMTISISASAPEQVLMENFDLAGSNTFLPATISGNNLSIITTSISGETYSGTGSISGNRITFNFTLDDGQTIEARTATADRL